MHSAVHAHSRVASAVARMLLLQGEQRQYRLLVAAERLLLPDRLSEELGETVTLTTDALDIDAASETNLLVDSALRGSISVRVLQGGAVATSETSMATLLEAQVQWLDCTVALQPLPNPDSSAACIDRVNASVSRFTERRIQARLDATLSLPPLSKTTQSLLLLSQSRDADVEALVAVLEQDAALASRIVGWANSAHYAAPGNVESIHDAVVRVLGFEGAVNMALGLAVGNSVPSLPNHLEGVPPHWTEALLTAATMENLARAMNQTECPPGLAYLTGLLSNLGTLVLGYVFPPQFERICALRQVNAQLLYAYCDLEVLGLTRDVLAAELLACWGLPEPVVVALRSQHEPDNSEPMGCLLGYTRSLLAQEGLSSYPVASASPRLPIRLGLEFDAVAAALATIRDPDFELPSLAAGG